MSTLHSFLWLSNIPLFVCTTFCLSVFPLIDVCVVFSFWLSRVELLILYPFGTSLVAQMVKKLSAMQEIRV